MNKLINHLAGEMAKLKEAGTYKEELVLESPQDARVRVNGREVVMLTSNNYLGFANHPRVREAQKKAIDRWGAGMASVRFICGTETLHRDLETEIAAFFGTDDAILYMTCWNANEGLFAAILSMTPCSSAVPRPVAPRTPVAWESSTARSTSFSPQIRASAARSASSPSIEKTPSVIMRRKRDVVSATSIVSKAAMSLCGTR